MHASHSAESVRMTVSVTEASAILGISRSLAYELIAKRELPSIRFGRRVLVPVSALERLVGSTTSADQALV